MNSGIRGKCAVGTLAGPLLFAVADWRICRAGEPIAEVRHAMPAAVLAVNRIDNLEVRPAVPILRNESSGAMAGVEGCLGHRMGASETLQQIAERGGSVPALISAYNRLASPPEAGQMLVIPRLRGLPASLKSEAVIVERGSTSHARVAVTLDAGSGSEPVPQMLRILRERGLKITFFLTGDFIAANPGLVRQMTAEGHEFGNHSLTHPDFRKLSEIQMRHELLATERLLNMTSGATTRPFFRPPYGEYNDKVLLIAAEEGFLPVYWTLDSLDSVGATKSPQFIFDRMTARRAPEELRGSIFLMHCDSDPSAVALPFILDRLRQMGLEVAKLSRVLNAD